MSMAFVKDKTGSMQTSVNAAASMVVAALAAGTFKGETDDPTELADLLFQAHDPLTAQIFEKMGAVVDEDNEKFKKEGYNPASNSTGKRGSKRGGGKSAAKDDDFEVEGGGHKLGFGTFKGQTIATVFELSKSQVAENFDYSRSGKAYVLWLAKNQCISNYKANREACANARAFLDEIGEEYETE